jgi:hypothetical protein
MNQKETARAISGLSLYLFETVNHGHGELQYLDGRDMGGGYFGQKPPLIAGYPGADNCDPFALAHEPGLCTDYPLPLVAQQTGVQIYRQRKTFPVRANFNLTQSQNSGGYICKPQHGAGMDRAERITNTLFDRHGADDAVFFALIDEKLDFTGFSAFIDLVLDYVHIRILLKRSFLISSPFAPGGI